MNISLEGKEDETILDEFENADNPDLDSDLDVDLGDSLGEGLGDDLGVGELDFSDISEIIKADDIENNLDEDLFADAELEDSLDGEEI